MRLALDGTLLDTLPVGSHPIAVVSTDDAIWVALEDAEPAANISLAPQTQTAHPNIDRTTLRVALASFGVETLDPSMGGSGGFCQNSVSGQNSIIPHLLRRPVHVLPTLPVHVYI